MSFSQKNVFHDVSILDENLEAIEYVHKVEILSGYPDGNFKPSSFLNRAEFAKVVLGLAKYQIDEENCALSELNLPDLKSTDWHQKSSCIAINEQLILPIDGYFKAENPISFSDLCRSIAKIYPIETDSSDDVQNGLNFLSTKRAIPISINSLQKPLTRAEVSEIIYRLENNIMTKTSLQTENFR